MDGQTQGEKQYFSRSLQGEDINTDRNKEYELAMKTAFSQNIFTWNCMQLKLTK